MAVQISKADLSTKVEAGWKKTQLAEHYGIPVTQMTKALQAAGLQIRKFHTPKFELVDDTQDNQGDPVDEILQPENFGGAMDNAFTNEVYDTTVSEVDHQAEEEVLQDMQAPQPTMSEEDRSANSW